MDNNTNYTEKLVRYLDAELNEAEIKALRAELENNTAMQQEMDNLLFAKDVIKNYGLTQKVNGMHQTMMQELTKAQTNTKAAVRSLPKMMMRIAAGIILLAALFGLYQYLTVSPGNLYNDQYTVYQPGTMRGTSAANALEKAYDEKNYAAVIAVYQQIANPSVTEQFLAGQSYLNKAGYNNAIALFEGIIEKNATAQTGTLNDEAEYYLALSYLKNNETTKALPLFKKIHDDPNHLYHTRISSWYLTRLKLLNWKN